MAVEQAAWLGEIEWLFFDVGNVLVSDDPSGSYCYQALYRALAQRAEAAGEPMEPVAEFFERRTAHMRAGGNLWKFVAEHEARLDAASWRAFQQRVRADLYAQWPAMSPAIPGMHCALARLAESGRYRLGIIANQPKEVRPLLAERGLLQHFKVVGISDELEIEKPNPAFFQWSLRQAGCAPGAALMIGDRIDNDVRPARALGMRTLWLRLTEHQRGWIPVTDFDRAYMKSLGECSASDRPPTGTEEEPDLTAASPEDLVTLLLR